MTWGIPGCCGGCQPCCWGGAGAAGAWLQVCPVAGGAGRPFGFAGRVGRLSTVDAHYEAGLAYGERLELAYGSGEPGLTQGQGLALAVLGIAAVGVVAWLVLKDGDGDCLIRPGTVLTEFGKPGSLFVVGSDCEAHDASASAAVLRGAPTITVVDDVLVAIGRGAAIPVGGPLSEVNWRGPTQLPGITEPADPGNAPGGRRVGAASTIAALAQEYWGDSALAPALAVANLNLVGSTSGGYMVEAGTWLRVPSKRLAEKLAADLSAAAGGGTGILG